MKNIFLTLLVFATATLSLHAQNLNFSGTWTRITEQTKITGRLSINSVPVSLIIKQNKDSINIERNSINGNGEKFSYTEKLKIAGDTVESQPKPGLNKKSSVKWSADKKSLIETAVYTDAEGNEVQTLTETWSLESDGKQLRSLWVMTYDGQTATIDAVFDKE